MEDTADTQLQPPELVRSEDLKFFIDYHKIQFMCVSLDRERKREKSKRKGGYFFKDSLVGNCYGNM